MGAGGSADPSRAYANDDGYGWTGVGAPTIANPNQAYAIRAPQAEQQLHAPQILQQQQVIIQQQQAQLHASVQHHVQHDRLVQQALEHQRGRGGQQEDLSFLGVRGREG